LVLLERHRNRSSVQKGERNAEWLRGLGKLSNMRPHPQCRCRSTHQGLVIDGSCVYHMKKIAASVLYDRQKKRKPLWGIM
jgi:hypothetical protein